MFNQRVISCIALDVIPLVNPDDLLENYRDLDKRGFRVLSFFARKENISESIILLLICINDRNELSFLKSIIDKNEKYFLSLTPEFACFHIFEREIYEQTGVIPKGHPWLKSVRSPTNNMDEYSFFKIEGKEVHEVGVGPIHAGIIEPGHFRFMCMGETVHHLEIQLGFQHRGIEEMILKKNPKTLTAIMESIAGDSAVAHVMAYSMALESISGTEISREAVIIRAIALELERISMHLAGITGLATDVAYLPGASTYGRLRTATINLSMRLCGNRFGRSWVCPGGVRYAISQSQKEDIQKTLINFLKDFAYINDAMFTSKSVLHRLKNTGAVLKDEALEIGLVGMIARSCGVSRDLRIGLDTLAQTKNYSGDCLSRALIRRDEILNSAKWILDTLSQLDGSENIPSIVKDLKPNSLAVAAVEGWRGEIIHCIETDQNSNLVRYHIQDPSFRNWFGLAYALRENAISDFPICNKSFDLSYCGNDL